MHMTHSNYIRYTIIVGVNYFGCFSLLICCVSVCMHNHVCIFVCYVSICLQSPSNQRFYRKITGYGMSVGDHRVA